MTKLSFLEAEARRVLRRIPPRRVARLQESLVVSCAARWAEMRGEQPAAPLARAVWEVCRPMAEIFIELYARADPRLDEVLHHITPAQALALLALAEIARGNAEGARTAYDSMALFESPAARNAHTRRVVAELTAGGGDGAMHANHRNLPRLQRAVATVAAQIGRYDSSAVFSAIRVIAQAQASPTQYSTDPALQSVLQAMQRLGVTFLGVQGARLFYATAAERKSVPVQRLLDFLARTHAERRFPTKRTESMAEHP